MPRMTQQDRIENLEARVKALEERLDQSAARGQELLDQLRLARAKQLVAQPDIQEKLATAFATRLQDQHPEKTERK
jgi:hypothetical protein